MNTVKCPKCGSSMVLRTARRGRNTGGQFYGCSRYPKCNETLPADSVPPSIDYSMSENDKEEQSFVETAFPRSLVGRAKFHNYQVRFVESVALPIDWLEAITTTDFVNPKALLALSQWRVDFPIIPSRYTLDEDHRRVISIIEKILTRGRITLLPHSLEESIQAVFSESSHLEPSLSVLDSCSWNDNQSTYEHAWLDSTEESIFYHDILPTLLGQSWHQFVIPQVEISSLLSPGQAIDSSFSQRVDFAMFLPWSGDSIIVEIDGAQHAQHSGADLERDVHLEQAGHIVIRIPAHEIQSRNGPKLAFLQERFASAKQNQTLPSTSDDTAALIRASRIAHQIQLVILQAIQLGLLHPEKLDSWHIVSDLDQLSFLNKNTAATLLNQSAVEFVELYARLYRLYSVASLLDQPRTSLLCDHHTGADDDEICICFSDKSSSSAPSFYVQNIYFPFHIAASSFPTSPFSTMPSRPDQEDIEYFLQYLFRKPTFWEGQYDGITRTLQSQDSLILLPTGAGKSIIYQLASLLLPGRTIVIDPIIALIDDQIDNLAMMGIDRCIGITSQIVEPQDRARAMQLFGQGEYLFAYVAPERFQTIEFRDSLRALTVHTPIAAIAVDEAHCISEWGHDFRTAYLNIGRTSRNFCRFNDRIPPLIALTGTASRSVLKDIQRELQIDDFDAIITPQSFDRPELKFHILTAQSDEKSSRLNGFLGQKLPSLFNVTRSTFYQARGKSTYSGIIFCPWVNGQYGVVHIADEISSDLGVPTVHYSGKAPKGWDSATHRRFKRESERNFKKNDVPLLVSTKAFGMGIDKANIRYTVHYGIPPSIESFYQEAGRAGRDREDAHCCIIVSNDDPQRSDKLLNPNTAVEEVDQILKAVDWDDNDDITRDLFFHTNAFRGVEQEGKDIEEVLHHLGDVSRRREVILSLPALERNAVEKALHRLLLVGVVSDYTIDYSAIEFGVKLSGATKEQIIQAYGVYVGSYLHSRRHTEVEKATRFLSVPLDELIPNIIKLLLQFIYEVIERGRRRALHEMLLACTTSPTDKDIRDRILSYLEVTEYSEDLEELITDDNVGISKCQDIFGRLRSPNEAAEVRGQVSRYLESYPDHPGLLMLRFLSEMLARDANAGIAKQNFKASITSARDNYGQSQSSIIEIASWAVSSIGRRHKGLANELVGEILATYPTKDSAKELLRKLPTTLSEQSAWFLLANLEQACNSFILDNGG